MSDVSHGECQEKSIKEEQHKAIPSAVLLPDTAICALALSETGAFNFRDVYFFPESIHICSKFHCQRHCPVNSVKSQYPFLCFVGWLVFCVLVVWGFFHFLGIIFVTVEFHLSTLVHSLVSSAVSPNTVVLTSVPSR